MTKFVKRTIHSGKVKVYGNIYKPKEPVPDHFEGLVVWFGLYSLKDDIIVLWGTDYYHKSGPDDEKAYQHDVSLLTRNGYFEWEWWYKQENNG